MCGLDLGVGIKKSSVERWIWLASYVQDIFYGGQNNVLNFRKEVLAFNGLIIILLFLPLVVNFGKLLNGRRGFFHHQFSGFVVVNKGVYKFWATFFNLRINCFHGSGRGVAIYISWSMYFLPRRDPFHTLSLKKYKNSILTINFRWVSHTYASSPRWARKLVTSTPKLNFMWLTHLTVKNCP